MVEYHVNKYIVFNFNVKKPSYDKMFVTMYSEPFFVNISLTQNFKHEYLRSRASRCLSLSSASSGVLEIYRDTRAYILDLASTNFTLLISKFKWKTNNLN